MADAINVREMIGAITPHNPAILSSTDSFDFDKTQTTPT